MDHQLYLQTFTAARHVNWDAAITLGTCAIVVCRLAYQPVNLVYRRFNAEPQGVNFNGDGGMSWLWYVYNFLLGIIITVVVLAGCFAAVILLGYWIAQGMHLDTIDQGVVRDHSHAQWIPYHG